MNPLHLSWLNSLTIAGVAQKLQREIPHGVILDQYRNVRIILCLLPMIQPNNIFSIPFSKVNNPRAHELTTGPEIIEAVVSTASTPSRPSSLKVDVFIAGTGTGGTITGVSRAIKKARTPTATHDRTEAHNPTCVVVGVDPVRHCPIQLL